MNTVTFSALQTSGGVLIVNLSAPCGLLWQQDSLGHVVVRGEHLLQRRVVRKGLRQGRLCAVFISLFLLQGCSLSSDPRSDRSGSISSFIAPDNENLSIEETTEEQARREVLSTPTNFIIPLDSDKEAWERATFFLENYSNPVQFKDAKGGRAAALITSVVGSRWTLANPPGNGSYSYQVSKQAMSKNGYRYLVVCQPRVGGNKYQASLNGANLARFIKDGKLEVSLLREIPQK
jgi:hypothetical protein